ncbi:YcnI family copper-binding membrane protein [Paenibacillus sp. A14]|uniref:YcnI family copper-binding membrane protein n=1 Tax=Paenibacillus sp. A14 TaxID=3119820 RepID=UPI002FDF4E1B
MKKFFSRFSLSCATVLLGFTLFAGWASAHVTVKPGTSAPGAWETYSIKVPVEKDIPTVKVSLKIPEGLDFKQYRPVPDWKVELTKNDDGQVTAVAWVAEGKGIGPGEFQQFEFVGKNPDSDSALAWDAFQYYSDGSIVEWIGEKDSDNPHSITKVTADAAGAAEEDHAVHGHDSDARATGAAGGNTDTGAGTGANAGTKAAAPDEAQDGGTSAVEIGTLILSLAALLVSLAALFAALRSRKRTS